MSAKEKCEDKKDESEECKETDGIQYSDNDINNFINKKRILIKKTIPLKVIILLSNELSLLKVKFLFK